MGTLAALPLGSLQLERVVRGEHLHSFAGFRVWDSTSQGLGVGGWALRLLCLWAHSSLSAWSEVDTHTGLQISEFQGSKGTHSSLSPWSEVNTCRSQGSGFGVEDSGVGFQGVGFGHCGCFAFGLIPA